MMEDTPSPHYQRPSLNPLYAGKPSKNSRRGWVKRGGRASKGPGGAVAGYSWGA